MQWIVHLPRNYWLKSQSNKPYFQIIDLLQNNSALPCKRTASTIEVYYYVS